MTAWIATRLNEFEIRVTSPEGEAWIFRQVNADDGFYYFLWRWAESMLTSPAWCASVDAELDDAEVSNIAESIGMYNYAYESDPSRYCLEFARALEDARSRKPTNSAATLPAAAVAEGLERDGESLEPGESS